DPGVLSGVLEGHGDAVWGLAFNPAGDRLASCSADGTVRIWDPRREDGACLSTYNAQSGEQPGGRPLGVGDVTATTLSPCCPLPHRARHPHLRHLLGHPAQPRRGGFPDGHRGGSQVNQVVSHPSQPLTITASDDRGIRFLDNRTGWGGAGGLCHDCSLRLWHLAHKTCVQELTAHRKKHEEAVHAVAFHPSRALSASAGADALAKVFV
ncbi:STRN4 protein, partial [Herpetotheres cachinnans]|nr:STRN4 protein [Herpetotheres cachinnans]